MNLPLPFELVKESFQVGDDGHVWAIFSAHQQLTAGMWHSTSQFANFVCHRHAMLSLAEAQAAPCSACAIKFKKMALPLPWHMIHVVFKVKPS